MLPDVAPAPVLPPGKSVFSALSAHCSFVPCVGEERKVFPSSALRCAESWTVLCFRSCCKIKEGNGFWGKNCKFLEDYLSVAPAPGVGQWGMAWDQVLAWSGNLRRGQTPKHPSVGEHPEPARLCPCSLHSAIHPERGGTCYVFADV